MKFSELVTMTFKALRKMKTPYEGGHAIHVEMQKKGYEAGLQASTVSLMHAFNENQNLLIQTATVEFLNLENTRLWDERQELLSIQEERQSESNKMAQQGFVEASKSHEQETNNTVGRQIFILNEKLTGIRIALDHAVHAGGCIFEERAIQPVNVRRCFNKAYASDYGKSVINPLNTKEN